MLDNKVKNCYTCNPGGTFMEYLFVNDSILSPVLWLTFQIVNSRALVTASSGRSLHSINTSLDPISPSINSAFSLVQDSS